MTGRSWAQATVREVRVEGAQRIEADTIRSYMSFKQGDRADEAALDKSLKGLFDTGLFADVTVRREGDVVVVRVVENPIINRLAFEGNQRIKDEDLQKEVQLRPRIVYTRSRVQSDVQRLIDIYRRSGRFAATVVPKVIQLPQNRVDLVFEIREGELTEIRKITFVGNKQFSNSTLRGIIQTKESAWYRFLNPSDTYDPDRLTFDRELLRRYYLSEGYADFRVVSVVAELTENREAFFVTFTVEEGERYKFGEVGLDTSLKDLDPAALREKLAIADGDWYDADSVETSISNLTDAAGSAGYAFVEVTPRIRRDREKKTISVDFVIQEGPRVFVEQIAINGNVRTEDRVIRREFQLVEGDAFNTAKLRRSRSRIQNLGFFEKVDVTNVPGSTEDKTVINVNVTERSTGEISFGAGFSSSSGLLGDITVRERNLLGKGQDLRVGLQLGVKQSQIDLSFTEPYFLDRELSAGFDIFRTERDLQEESSFDRKSTGGALRAGYRISEHLIQRWKYGIREDEITNIASDASLAIQEQRGQFVTSEVGHRILYDLRNSRFDPSEGYYIGLDTDLAGLGGDVRYLRNSISAGYFHPFGGDFVGSVRGGAGYIFGIDDEIRIVDRYFLGGGNLRGFANAGVGPRDVASDDALGGNLTLYGTLEMVFPLGLPNEFGIKGRAFTDFGTLGQLDNSRFGSGTDTMSLRMSAGVGISWRSPFGPINIDLGQAILKEEFDNTEIFRFSFGTSF